MIDEKETAIVKAESVPIESKPAETIQVKRSGEDLDLVMSNMVPGAGQIELTEKQIGILYAPTDSESIEIRPDGLIYLPWMEYLTRLRQAFGLNWAVIPRGEPGMGPNKTSILWGFYLVIQGKLAGYAIGEQAYKVNNPVMNWSDACEGAKSNALMRLCKGIGIGLELWKPSFIRSWKEKYAEKYKDNYGKELWRKKGKISTEPIADVVIAEVVPEETEPAEGDFFKDGFGDAEKSQVPKPKPEPNQGSFFTDDEIQAHEKSVKNIVKEVINVKESRPIYDETAREAIINAIKESLKADKIDESEFRLWLSTYQIGCTPPRHFVGLQYGILRFHMGDGEDLKFLYSKLGDAIKKFRHYKKGIGVV